MKIVIFNGPSLMPAGFNSGGFELYFGLHAKISH